jgi:hypothetical protein
VRVPDGDVSSRKAQEQRRRLKEQYADLFEKVAALLYRGDPIGINPEDHTDEYEQETSRILPRLRSCKSAADVTTAVHQVFIECFDGVTAGPERRYEQLGEDIWRLWTEHIREQPARP